MLKLIVRVRISHILIYIYKKKIVDMKTGFLRIFLKIFIEVKRTIVHGSHSLILCLTWITLFL